MSGRCYGRGHISLIVYIDDDAILRELLLNKNDLLHTLNDEVPARIQWAFPKSCKCLFTLV
eukprot:12161822-Ditylum_brightwellii.AAC.1